MIRTARNPLQTIRYPAIAAAFVFCAAGGGCRRNNTESSGGGWGEFKVPVEVAEVTRVDWPLVATAVGSLTADEQVTLRNAVAEVVREIPATEGTPVEPGDVLLRLEDAKLKLDVRQAEARFEQAEANLQRKQPLFEDAMIAEAEIIEARSTFKAAEAALGLARERLSDATITAPFAGQLGRRFVAVGDYVQVGSALFDLVKIDRLKLDFALPEALLSQLALGQQVDVASTAYPGETFRGEIDFIDPVVDPATRTVRLRAVVANDDLRLRPNLFVNVELRIGTLENARVIPEAAVVPGLGSTAAFVVEDGKAKRRVITIERRRPGQVVVSEGLEAGETIVVAGQQKLRDDTPVQIEKASERAS